MIAKYFGEAEPSWPEELAAPPGTPSVVVVVVDDVGYAQLGCYGSDIATPHIDELARTGLQFTNFHTTALCSSSRAALLTGRNHHRNGMGRVIELATGFPGYNSRIPFENGFLSEGLVANGYATMAAGKWHLTPESECHAAATRVRWPLARGFERFYGFMSGETHQFAPALYRDNHILRNADVVMEDGYHLTSDLVANAAQFVRDVRSIDPRKPFFLYFATGACHSPHQAPPSWIDRYRGAFDAGWDEWRLQTFGRQMSASLLPASTELSPRPPWVPAWSSLTADERRLYSRYMEAFAGYLSHTDDCLGRLFSELRACGAWEDTIVVLLSDNGASSEGGPTGSLNDLGLWNRMTGVTLEESLGRVDEIGGPYIHNNYPWGWTVAGNTPFRRWKREVHEGGVADPLIISWPSRLAEVHGLRRQYVHVVDIAPTLLSLAGLKAPETIRGVPQSRVDGVDFSAACFDAAAAETRTLQYFEMFGSRALYKAGWKAVTYHEFDNAELSFEEDRWELYNVAVDASECHDLAAAEPQRLRDMVDDWWIEAARNNVLPLDNRPFSEWARGKPNYLPKLDRFTYYPGISQIPEVSAVDVKRRWHRVTAFIESEPGDELRGTLISQGSALGGWALYVISGQLVYVHNLLGRIEYQVSGALEPGGGPRALECLCEPQGDGFRVTLAADGEQIEVGAVEVATPVRFSLTGAGLTCGYSNALAVTRRVSGLFSFTGGLRCVTVEVAGPRRVDPEGEAWAAIAEQ